MMSEGHFVSERPEWIESDEATALGYLTIGVNIAFAVRADSGQARPFVATSLFIRGQV